MFSYFVLLIIVLRFKKKRDQFRKLLHCSGKNVCFFLRGANLLKNEKNGKEPEFFLAGYSEGSEVIVFVLLV